RRAEPGLDGSLRGPAAPAARAGRAALPLQHAGRRAAADPQRPAPRRRDARPPDPVPAPFAAARRGRPVNARRRARARHRLPRDPEDPHGPAPGSADRRPGIAARHAAAADDAADAGRERDQARPRAAYRRRHRLDPRAPRRRGRRRQRPRRRRWRARQQRGRQRHRPEERARAPAAALRRARRACGGGELPRRRRRHDHRPRRARGGPRMNNDRTWTAIVAEDEALLRDALVEGLRVAWPELEVLAECEDGASALEALAEHQPDIAFLDIRMPGLTGLEVAASLADTSPRTQVVFITAYDQYAIEAFEQGAIDYLLKPITPERLAATVDRLQMRASGDAEALAALVAKLEDALAGRAADARPPLTWLTASAGRETRLVLVDDVAYFRAADKYTTVVTAEGEALLRTPIRELLTLLDPSVFKQVHRSTIVNLRAVAAVTRDDAGRGTLRLKSRPETLAVSQPYMGLFRNM